MSAADVAAMNGFLQAFEVLNRGADHDTTFTLHRIGEATDDPDLSVARHLSPNNYQLRLDKLLIHKWEHEVAGTLDRWLFDLLVTPDVYTNNMVGERFFDLLGKVLGNNPIEAWNVVIDGAVDGGFLQPFYECEWSDYLFRSGEGIFLLHFGVSD